MVKRPLLFGVVAFVIGELTGLNPYMTMGLGMVVAFLLIYFVWDRRRKRQTMPFLMLFFGISFFLGILNGWRCQLPDPFLDYLEGSQSDTISCTMQGTVTRLKYKENQRILLVRTERIEQAAFINTRPYVIKLYERLEDWDEEKETEGCDLAKTDSSGDSEVFIGNQIVCEMELQIISEPTNPGEFNSKQYYQARGIDFLGYTNEVEVLTDTRSPIRQGLIELQGKAQAVFYQCLSEENAGLMSAMLLGSSGELDSQLRKLYQRNGIAHVLAISGLHISIIGSILYQLLRKVGASYWSAGIPVILLLMLYGWLTGFSGSTIRAVIMFVMTLTGDMLGRTYDMLTAVGVSCLCILIENPYRLWDAGFLLSFSAVLSLGVAVPALQEYIEPLRKGKIRWYLASNLLSGVVLQMMTGPIVVYFYYDYPVYGVVLNLIVVPLMTPVLICGFAGLLVYPIVPWLGQLILLPCEWILNLLSGLCHWTEALPGAVWHIGAISIWEIVLYYTVILLVYGLIKYRKTAGSLAVLLVYFSLMTITVDNELKIVMLDVGQGDCILLETPGHHHILMDGGSSSRSKIGEYVITPAVKYYGSGCLDYVFISHMDQDHVNGIEELIALSEDGGIQIRSLVVPDLALYDIKFQELILKAEEAGIQVYMMHRGEQIVIDEVVFTCLYPDSENGAMESSNETSMVLWVEYQEFDMMLTGDLEAGGEQQILSEYPADWLSECDLLKVGHHGSKYSSSEVFLEQLTPWLSIVSCGEGNRYGHPHEETLERLEDVGSRVLTTPDCGAIIVKVGQEMEIWNWKK